MGICRQHSADRCARPPQIGPPTGLRKSLTCLAVICLLLAASRPPVVLGEVPDPETIRETAGEVVSGPDYQLEKGLDGSSRSLLQTILSWLLAPFLWLFQALDGLPMFLRIVVSIVLSIVAILLIIHIIWSLAVAVRGTKKTETVRALQEKTTDPGELEAAADEAAGKGFWLDAVRLLLRAALVRIERAERKKFRRGLTNRELLRRYRRTALSDPLTRLIEVVDRKWYGDEDCQSADYEVCRTQHASIRTLTEGRPDAVRP